jgi:hypothetical protein
LDVPFVEDAASVLCAGSAVESDRIETIPITANTDFLAIVRLLECRRLLSGFKQK